MTKRVPGGAPPISARAVALIVATALFMINLDATIIITSLPQMAAYFGVSVVDMNAAIIAYLLVVAAFIPLSGWMADRFGARRVFAISIALFTLASVACAFAPSFAAFVLARMVQGLGGAMILPVGRIIVLRNAAKHEIVDAIALITWPALIAPVIGPVLGGAITNVAGWHWNFLINVPIGALGLMLAMRIPDIGDVVRRRLDMPGSILSSTALVALMLGLELVAQLDTIILGAASLAVALILGVAAIGWFRRTDNPLLDLSPFALASFRHATLEAGTLHRVAIGATPFLLPVMLQTTWGLSPVEAGLILLVYFLGNLSMKTVTTPMLRWFGFRTVLIVNGLLVSAAVAACGLLNRETATPVVWLVVFVAGATRSMQMTALNTLAFADIAPVQRSSASTLSGMMMQLSMALGVAVAALLLRLAQIIGNRVALEANDFTATYFAVAGLSVIGVLLLFRLAPDVGAEISGHQPKKAAKP